MGRYHKGEMSRAGILEKARKILNEQGLGIGVELIAKEMGLSRGRITHFFPTKDSILVGIMRDYEHRLGELLHHFDWNQGSLFDQHFSVLNIVLDLQYEYRCAHSFIAVIGKNQPEMLEHIEASFFNRVDGIHMRIKMMVEAKLLEASILEKDQLDVFIFQYTTLLTSWVISQDIYYGQKKYSKMKPVYIKGAMQLFLPFLTKRGNKEFLLAAAGFNRKSTDHTAKKK
jgi:AcrR family transcriptional regulator